MSWDTLEAIAYGQLRMSEDEFWSMTPRTFFNALEGWMAIYRTDMEIRRLGVATLLNAWITKPIEHKKLWAYPWESSERSSEEIEDQRKRGKALAEKIKNNEQRKNSRPAV